MNAINKAIKNSASAAIFTMCLSSLSAQAAPSSLAWTDSTTAAAAAYCMAKHPAGTPGTYTEDGYEYSDARGSGGIVGAVRRNFVAGKRPANGLEQTCNQACEQAALFSYPKSEVYPESTAKALTRKVGETIQADGIGDFASSGITDSTHGYADFKNRNKAIAAVWGRPNNYIEGDGTAQSDLCCCHVVLTPY